MTGLLSHFGNVSTPLEHLCNLYRGGRATLVTLLPRPFILRQTLIGLLLPPLLRLWVGGAFRLTRNKY